MLASRGVYGYAYAYVGTMLASGGVSGCAYAILVAMPMPCLLYTSPSPRDRG